jgi:hypothetical protein
MVTGLSLLRFLIDEIDVRWDEDLHSVCDDGQTDHCGPSHDRSTVLRFCNVSQYAPICHNDNIW